MKIKTKELKKIEQNYRQYDKYEYQIRDLCHKYLERKVTFGILFNFLKRRKIIVLK